MAWKYELQAERRTPPCPSCASVTGVVRLKPDVFVCMDCTPRRAFGATWIDEGTPLPVSADDLSDAARQALADRAAGIGKQHRIAYEAGWVAALLWAEVTDAFIRDAS
jgi:ribosomal protein L37AE/L43A